MLRVSCRLVPSRRRTERKRQGTQSSAAPDVGRYGKGNNAQITKYLLGVQRINTCTAADKTRRAILARFRRTTAKRRRKSKYGSLLGALDAQGRHEVMDSGAMSAFDRQGHARLLPPAITICLTGT